MNIKTTRARAKNRWDEHIMARVGLDMKEAVTALAARNFCTASVYIRTAIAEKLHRDGFHFERSQQA